MKGNKEALKVGRKIAQIRLGKITVNLVTLPIALLLVMAFILFTNLLPHTRPYASRDLIYYVILIIVSIVAHEGLHALALVIWGGVGIKDIKFGFSWRGVLPYSHLKVPVPIKTYRLAALLPLFILTGLFTMLLLIFPSIWLAAVTGIAIAGSIGDIWIFYKLRRFDRKCLVKDHPKEIGYDVFENPAKHL